MVQLAVQRFIMTPYWVSVTLHTFFVVRPACDISFIQNGSFPRNHAYPVPVPECAANTRSAREIGPT